MRTLDFLALKGCVSVCLSVYVSLSLSLSLSLTHTRLDSSLLAPFFLSRPRGRRYATAVQTPLHYACRFENIKNAQMLLDFGANPLAETSDGQTVLDAASKAQYSVRKKLADILNEALERMDPDDEEEEEEEEASAGSDEL